MRSRSLIVFLTLPMLLAAGSAHGAKPAAKAAVKPVEAVPAAAAQPPSSLDVDAIDFQTVQPPNPADETALLPYVLDLPHGWEMNPWAGGAFLVLGPHGQLPPTGGAAQNPWVIVLHPSPNKFPGADAAIEALKANAAKTTAFALLSASHHDFGGLQGMLALTESGSGDKRARTLTVRVPLGQGTLDVIASAPVADFPTFQALYERVLFSLQPAATE